MASNIPQSVAALATLPSFFVMHNVWRSYANSFLAMRSEVYVRIIKHLNPLDAVCLSLVYYASLWPYFMFERKLYLSY